MNAHDYTKLIKLDTQQEYKDYQDLLYNSIKKALSQNKDKVDITWKKVKITVDLNHSSFLIGYNYGVTTTLIDFEKEQSKKKTK